MPFLDYLSFNALHQNALSLKCPFGNALSEALSKMPFIMMFFFKMSYVMPFLNLPFIKLPLNKNAVFSLFMLFQIVRFQMHEG